MYYEWVKKINSLFEASDHDKQVIDKINKIISFLDTDEQLRIHSDLSEVSLKGIYTYRNEININDHAKEHITWWYFRQMVDTIPPMIPDKMLNEIIDEYRRVKYIALESIILNLMKNERLSLKQVDSLKSEFHSKAFHKEAISFKAKNLIRSRIFLDKEFVGELLQAKAYDVLEFAIDNHILAEESFVLFMHPSQGEENGKVKKRLFDKIQKHMAK
ncbi:hypothetical protein [Paenibacillus eucommiae]|uniref:Uncharacterized protein n=1 Tax=Paenibacillus eucommiae TaxID=1355755 RepID=A0ABS4IUB6_9BACL|nr:hypothetical protein [Paenibacillus eucommiae]MBP1991160.1 hypothetical protein [Paenibacillus eucommiae]